ncbi:MAG TPA: hypothetical protein VLS44_08895 [Nitrospira sp.]|nr:hypothetical protein [Nitrospira sp.]
MDRRRGVATDDPSRFARHRRGVTFLTGRAGWSTGSTGCTWSVKRGFRHPHDLLGHAVSLPLIRIARLAYSRLCLQEQRQSG